MRSSLRFRLYRFPHRGLKAVHTLVEFSVADVERRQEAQDMRPRLEHEYTVSAADFAQFFRAARPFRAQHSTYHQSLAPDLGDESGLVVERNKTLAQPLALAFNIGQEVARTQLAQNFPRHRGSDGISAESGSVAAWREALGRLGAN